MTGGRVRPNHESGRKDYDRLLSAAALGLSSGSSAMRMPALTVPVEVSRLIAASDRGRSVKGDETTTLSSCGEKFCG